MTDKRIIKSFIEKYYLGGTIERIKWTSDGESIKADFINDSQNLVGKIKTSNFKFPIGEFGIYSTSTLSKMLEILENEVMFEVVKEGGTPSRFVVGDTNVDIKFNLADPQVIPNVPSLNEMEGGTEIELDDEFVSTFIKSRDAVNDEIVHIITEQGFTSPEIKFTIGNASSNSISFSRTPPSDSPHVDEFDGMPFNALLIKEILKHNKNAESGTLNINPKGLMSFAFKFGDLEVSYYLVRNQN